MQLRATPPAGTPDALTAAPVPPSRRINRVVALLVCLALVCAAVTVLFGLWMTGVVADSSGGLGSGTVTAGSLTPAP